MKSFDLQKLDSVANKTLLDKSCDENIPESVKFQFYLSLPISYRHQDPRIPYIKRSLKTLVSLIFDILFTLGKSMEISLKFVG